MQWGLGHASGGGEDEDVEVMARQEGPGEAGAAQWACKAGLGLVPHVLGHARVHACSHQDGPQLPRRLT